MSLIDDSLRDSESHAERQADTAFDAGPHLRFVPKELAAKCHKLIDSYHTMHGYGCLPDMLWHSDARDIIECNRDLMKVFRNASKSRCAKRANESLLLIAAVVVSLEVLARDFAGWGKRFPRARREAEEMLGDLAQRERAWFMDKYLYPSLSIHREFANILAPSTAERAMIRN
jgi:hypothetical protein